MQIDEKRLESGFTDKSEYDKVWFGLVEEIAELDVQIMQEKASRDEDSLRCIAMLQAQLISKKHLLKRLDSEGLFQIM